MKELNNMIGKVMVSGTDKLSAVVVEYQYILVLLIMIVAVYALYRYCQAQSSGNVDMIKHYYSYLIFIICSITIIIFHYINPRIISL